MRDAVANVLPHNRQYHQKGRKRRHTRAFEPHQCQNDKRSDRGGLDNAQNGAKQGVAKAAGAGPRGEQHARRNAQCESQHHASHGRCHGCPKGCGAHQFPKPQQDIQRPDQQHFLMHGHGNHLPQRQPKGRDSNPPQEASRPLDIRFCLLTRHNRKHRPASCRRWTSDWHQTGPGRMA